MKISIVILNWNGKKLLEEFLPSVIENSKRAEIILVDNNSSDTSLEFLKKEFPEIKIIKHDNNLGYAKGYNKAIEEIDTDLLVLLNSDVYTPENWLTPMIEEFEKNESLSIAQPKILSYINKNKFDYSGACGGFIDNIGYPYCRGRIFFNIENDENQYDDIIDIDWASGACFFIRKNVYDNLGGIDEDFYLHMEEIDLCLRSKSLGYNIKIIPQSIVYHLSGGTLSQGNEKKIFYNFRNSLYFIVKNYKNFIWRILLRIIILDPCAAFLFMIRLEYKSVISIIKAHFSFYKNFIVIYKKRSDKFFIPKYNRNIIKDYFLYRKKTYKEL